MNKVRFAIIGCGGIADRRAIPGMLLSDGIEIVAVMDKSAEAARAVAENRGFAHWFDDAEEMLRTVPCDAVYIATPVFCHYEQVMLALRYGCHVLVEKPLALNKTQGQAMLDAFKAAGKQLSVGYMMSRHSLHNKMRDIVADGGIGKLNLARLQFFCWYPDIPGAWRQKKALSGGGCIADLAVHCLELFTSVTGEQIADYKAFLDTMTFHYEVEDSAVITFKTDKGTLGHIDVNFNIPDGCAPTRFELFGTEGSLIAENTLSQLERGTLRYVHVDRKGYDAQQNGTLAPPEEFVGEDGDMYQKQFDAFCAILNSGRCDYSGAEQAQRIQALCDEIYGI